MEQIISVLLRATGASQFGAQMSQIAGSAGVAQRAIQGAQGLMFGLKSAIVGAIGGVTIASVARLGGEFENTQNKMAGFLNALGQAPDFNSALTLSADLMKQIELSSAALPGEAEDYVKVFTTALPEVQRAVGGTLTEMVKFTNQMAAIGATMGIDPSQVARDVQLMLRAGQGGAGMDVRTFTSMLPFLKQVKGQANLTRESFNKLNEQGRARLLQKSMSLLAPMIEHASKSWDAVKGTTTSILKTMFRMSSGGLFDGLKNSLSRVNKLLMDDQGNLTAFANRIVDYGKRVGSFMGMVIDKGVTALENLFGQADKIPQVFQRIEKAVKSAALAMVAFSATSSVAGIFRAGLGAAGVGGVGLAGLAGVAVGLSALAAAAVLVAPAVYAASKNLDRFKSLSLELADQYSTEVLPATQKAASTVGKFFEPLTRALGQATIEATAAALRMLGSAATLLADRTEQFFDSLSYLMRQAQLATGPTERQTAIAQLMIRNAKDQHTSIVESRKAQKYFEGSAFFSTAKKNLLQFDNLNPNQTNAWPARKETFVPKPAPTTTPPGRGGAKVHQDFRGSKFTIAQKFEEGYDPDRVAVAFANDLRKIGEFRLQSGLEPMFGVGG